jgi:hypothetical protein
MSGDETYFIVRAGQGKGVATHIAARLTPTTLCGLLPVVAAAAFSNSTAAAATPTATESRPSSAPTIAAKPSA